MALRIVLVHWKPAEAAGRVAALARAGFDVSLLTPLEGGVALRPLAAAPPDAFVIDLSRLPSHGRAVATALRQRKGTRLVPIVFAGGEPDKVALARRQLPDAAWCDWRDVRRVLRDAVRAPLGQPIVPDTMAGYSGTPLDKKLGIKPDMVVAFLRAPPGFVQALGPHDLRIEARERAQGRADLVLLFVTSRADLTRRFPVAARMIPGKGGLWVAWPKKTSGMRTDLGEIEVRRFGLDAGWVDYKICAIDRTWSGLLFARRAPQPAATARM